MLSYASIKYIAKQYIRSNVLFKLVFICPMVFLIIYDAIIFYVNIQKHNFGIREIYLNHKKYLMRYHMLLNIALNGLEHLPDGNTSSTSHFILIFFQLNEKDSWTRNLRFTN